MCGFIIFICEDLTFHWDAVKKDWEQKLLLLIYSRCWMYRCICLESDEQMFLQDTKKNCWEKYKSDSEFLSSPSKHFIICIFALEIFCCIDRLLFTRIHFYLPWHCLYSTVPVPRPYSQSTLMDEAAWDY